MFVKIAYVGPYLSTAPGSAGMQRALGISRSLAAGGADVVIGTGDADDVEVPPAFNGFDGLRVEHMGLARDQRGGRAAKATQWFTFGRRAENWLQAMQEPDLVILYGGGASAARKLLRWGRGAGVPVAMDLVEWHDPNHQPLGRFGPFALDLELGMRRTYARTGNVIAISTYLRDHYSALGCRTLLVPPTTDVTSIWREEHQTVLRTPLRMAYAGSPGKKDYLRNVVEGIELADPSGERVVLDVVGPEPAGLLGLLGRVELPSWIRCHGRVSRERAMTIVAEAHYVPLLRPNKRYAHAGFPTKVVESFAVGTPVISNLTSDLNQHVISGKTGWVVADSTSRAFAEALKEALATDAESYKGMRLATRRHAESVFDFRNYTESIMTFVRAVRSEA